MRIENDFDNRFATDTIFFSRLCNLPTRISPKVSFGQNANTPMLNCNTKYSFFQKPMKMHTHTYMKIPNNNERCVIKCTSLNGARLSGWKFVKKNTKNNKKKNVSANAALSGGKLLLRSHFRRRCPPSTTRPFHERRRKMFNIFKIFLSSAFYF